MSALRDAIGDFLDGFGSGGLFSDMPRIGVMGQIVNGARR